MDPRWPTPTFAVQSVSSDPTHIITLGFCGRIHRVTSLYAMKFTRIFPCHVNIRMERKHQSPLLCVRYTFMWPFKAQIHTWNTCVQSRYYSNAYASEAVNLLLRKVKINRHNLLPWNSWNGRKVFHIRRNTRNRKTSFPYRIIVNKEEETK
jgi:hypothetical protein